MANGFINEAKIADEEVTFNKISRSILKGGNIVPNSSFENWANGTSNKAPDGFEK